MGENMSEKEKMLRETEAMLRAVLISSPRGVRFEKLLRDYKELTFKIIPYKELGFPNLESFLQSIPSVAQVERSPDGEWVVKGVASDADKHVAKLISKQKKPSIRRSAKSMIAKRMPITLPPRINTPFRKPVMRAPTTSNYKLPPRMQKQKQVQESRNKVPPFRQGGVKPAPSGKGQGHGELFKKTTEAAKIPQNSQHRSSSSSKDGTKGKDMDVFKKLIRQIYRRVYPKKETQKLSVSISNASKERKVTASVTSPTSVTSPERPTAVNVLDDAASVKWMKAVIRKAQSGLWSTRLQVLYKEKFKKVLPATVMEDLKFRPDIARIDEPIAGKYLLYAAKQQEPVASKAKQEDPSRVNASSDFALPHFFPDVGSSVIVYISFTEHPGCFYVSYVNSVSEKLSVEIRERYKSTRSTPEAIPSVCPGQIFCAQFTEDGNFYRACVLEVVDSKRVKVLYVDFGNKEVVPVADLRVLISDFRTQPVQAFECCLDGIQPKNQGQWSGAAITKFDELTSGRELRMTVLEIYDKVLSVSLVDVSSKLDIAEEMKKVGQAISTQNLESVSSSSSSSLSSSSGLVVETSSSRTDTVAKRSRRLKTKAPGIVELPEEQFLDVFVCNITGTYDIYLRLVGDEYSAKFEAIQESMTSYYSDSKDAVTTDPVIGELFALISDEVWCRVKVTSVNGGKLQVFFVDHGDTTETSKAELRPLAPQFRQLPFQVFQCALDGLPKTKNPDVVDKLKNLIMGEVAVAEIMKRTGDLVLVDLLDTRTDAAIPVNAVIRKLVIPDEELKPVLPKVGHTTDVEIAYISATGSVFLHVSSAGSKRLEELNKDLTEHYTSKRSKANEFISTPTAGKVCCAKCADDGNWYRAEVLSFNGKDMVEVLYVDFGNIEDVPVTNLREPTEENVHVLSLPFQALECQLYDVPKDGWNDEMVDRIFEIVEQGSLMAEVLSDGDLPSVSLLVTEDLEEGKRVTHRLASLLGFAISEDMYPDDDTQISSETDQESIGDEAGEKFVNRDKTGTSAEVNGLNPEMKNLEMENVGGGKAGQAHIGSTLVETSQQVREGKERPRAAEEISGGNTIAKRDASSKGGLDDSTGDPNAAQAVQADNVKVAIKQWQVLPLKTGWFDVYISDVKDPEHFTFQLFDNDPEICKFADELNDFYQNQAVESEVTLVEGEVYAALFEEDERWYRALVESLMNDDKAYVRFVDYGNFATVEKEDMRVLDEKFLELPFQGVQGRLAGVKSSKQKWSRQSMKSFKFLTFDRYLVARITSNHTEYDFDFKAEAVTLELCDTEDSSKDIFIAKKFLEENSDVLPA